MSNTAKPKKQIIQNQDDIHVRAKFIYGAPEEGIEGIFPVSPSEWYKGVKEGRYPAGIKIGKRITVWKKSDVLALLKPAE